MLTTCSVGQCGSRARVTRSVPVGELPRPGHSEMWSFAPARLTLTASPGDLCDLFPFYSDRTNTDLKCRSDAETKPVDKAEIETLRGPGLGPEAKPDAARASLLRRREPGVGRTRVFSIRVFITEADDCTVGSRGVNGAVARSAPPPGLLPLRLCSNDAPAPVECTFAPGVLPRLTP